jgi:hypothetical protein
MIRKGTTKHGLCATRCKWLVQLKAGLVMYHNLAAGDPPLSLNAIASRHQPSSKWLLWRWCRCRCSAGAGVSPLLSPVLSHRCSCTLCVVCSIAHLADHVPFTANLELEPPITFLISIVRFIHSRLVLWNKHHQAHPRSRLDNPRSHSNGPIQRTKTDSPSPQLHKLYSCT